MDGAGLLRRTESAGRLRLLSVIRQMGLSDAVVRVIDITVQATGTEDAWYSYAYDAVNWLLQARGVPANHEVRQAKTGFNARYPR